MIDLRFVGRLPSREALRARAVDDLYSLAGFYMNDLIEAEEDGRMQTVADLRKVVDAINSLINVLEPDEVRLKAEFPS
jgi:hypothetical protein